MRVRVCVRARARVCVCILPPAFLVILSTACAFMLPFKHAHTHKHFKPLSQQPGVRPLRVCVCVRALQGAGRAKRAAADKAERLANLVGPTLDRFLTTVAAKEAEEAANEVCSTISLVCMYRACIVRRVLCQVLHNHL